VPLFEEILGRFKDARVCVVGDIVADVYVFGRPYRLSREAPVIVVKYEGERILPGSAGNTVCNLASLGAKVYPLGFVGNDRFGRSIVEYLSGFENVNLEGLIECDCGTITKTRILAGDTHTSKQQVIRIDRDDRFYITDKARRTFMERLEGVLGKVDAICVSDYGYRTVDTEVADFLRKGKSGKITVGDSRYSLKELHGFTILTPNETEARELASMIGCGIGEDLESMGREILAALRLEALLITRGNKGMTLFLRDGAVHHIPATRQDEVTDVTGAGDTVSAVCTLCLASGADFLTAAKISNVAAGIVVMKRGTATVSREELLREIERWGG
jgi:rfaE bifunctional protein kinase chain/domain